MSDEKAAGATESLSKTASGMKGNGERVDILLIEDNPADAELCMRALKKHNLANHFLWLKDGAEALDFLFARGIYAGRSNHTLRVILLDLKLPKVDGLEVLRQVRADERLKTTPVVVLTSSTESRDLVESYNLGANSYVSKPVEFEAFTEAVAHLGLYWMIINKTTAQP